MWFIKAFQSRTFRISAIILLFSIFYALSWPIHDNSFKWVYFHLTQIIDIDWSLLIACQHFSSWTKLVFYRDFVAWTSFLCNHFPASRDVGDNYLTFRSFVALNLLRTNVRYNHPVVPFSGTSWAAVQLPFGICVVHPSHVAVVQLHTFWTRYVCTAPIFFFSFHCGGRCWISYHIDEVPPASCPAMQSTGHFPQHTTWILLASNWPSVRWRKFMWLMALIQDLLYEIFHVRRHFRKASR